jgi:SAM-dependent methyltransferase
MKRSRRDVLRGLGLGLALGLAPAQVLLAKERVSSPGNFSFIYNEAATREKFKKFLVNVFHLFPEDDLHELIFQAVKQGLDDEAAYNQVQARLGDIKPFLGDLRYSLPTLAKQKRVLADQTVALIDADRRYEGYLEIGSNGRFLDALEERLDIEGPCFSVADRAPTSSAIDIMDRGQLRKAGEFIDMNGYRPALSRQVPAQSLDLVTVYIGFHHCPVTLREEFLSQIRQVLRPGGTLIVRDHNVKDEAMWRMVALAHDVFNMGTQETWKYNDAELRNFYPLAKLERMMSAAGFKAEGKRLLQVGDPTLNTLMKFKRA